MKKGHIYTEWEHFAHNHDIGHRPNATTVKKAKAKLGNICSICGYSNPVGIDLHHIVPLYLGGKNVLKNTTCLCKNCHAEEHAKIR